MQDNLVYKGPWSRDEIDGFLAATRIPVRLAVNGASGHPVLASLWFLSTEDRIWCATKRSASIVSLLERDPRCAFEVAPESLPYHGVRGQAQASLHDDRGEEILRRLPDMEYAAGGPVLKPSPLVRTCAEMKVRFTPEA